MGLELAQGLVQLHGREVHLVHHAAEAGRGEGREGSGPDLPPPARAGKGGKAPLLARQPLPEGKARLGGLRPTRRDLPMPGSPAIAQEDLLTPASPPRQPCKVLAEGPPPTARTWGPGRRPAVQGLRLRGCRAQTSRLQIPGPLLSAPEHPEVRGLKGEHSFLSCPLQGLSGA